MSEDRSYKSLKFLGVSFVILLLAGFAVSATQPDVSIGSNGIEINSGSLDTGGGDITDGATTIWDSSTGNIATSVIDYSATTATDVGLENLLNKEQLAIDGTNSMNANLDLGTNNLTGISTLDAGNELSIASDIDFTGNAPFIQSSSAGTAISLDYDVDGGASDMALLSDDSIGFKADNDGSSGGSYTWSISGSDGDLNANSNALNNIDYISSGASSSSAFGAGTELGILAQSENALNLGSQGDVILTADTDEDSGGWHTCTLDSTDGSWDCSGTKNWIHDLGNGSEAVYTSQESPQVRAVYEGKAHVVDSKKIDLPSHFSSTVSDTEPELRAQVTPQGTLTNAAVMDKTDEYIEIAVQDDTDVEFRITGIRDGYEDKQVVREKEE